MTLELVPAELAAATIHGTFLQTPFWASFKAKSNWSWKEFSIQGDVTGRVLVMERKLFGPFSFAYVPHGPETRHSFASDAERTGFLSLVAERLKVFLPSSCVFVRFDPPWYVIGVDPVRYAFSLPFRKSSLDIQPPDTVVLDLAPQAEAILAGMKPKWRYNAKLAEKKGVTVSWGGSELVGDFYPLYRITSKRDAIALHPEKYYRGLFETAEVWSDASGLKPDLRVWTARHEGELLAAIITLFYGEEAVYLYGASSDSKRNLMPAYALQWAAIRAAKEAGCTHYDFYGIPPADDPGHPMYGLYRFKTGFGGEIRHFPGSIDFPLKPFVYGAYRAAEWGRMFWHKKVKKAALIRTRTSRHAESGGANGGKPGESVT